MDKFTKKRQDAAMWLLVYLVVVGIVAVWVGIALNRAAERSALISAYAGVGRGANRAFLVPLLVVVAVLVAVGGIAWRAAVRRIEASSADVPNSEELTRVFHGQVVTYHVRRGGMSHATVVKAAMEMGYELMSQGADGSLVFRRHAPTEPPGRA